MAEMEAHVLSTINMLAYYTKKTTVIWLESNVDQVKKFTKIIRHFDFFFKMAVFLEFYWRGYKLKAILSAIQPSTVSRSVVGGEHICPYPELRPLIQMVIVLTGIEISTGNNWFYQKSQPAIIGSVTVSRCIGAIFRF